ncbi:MULTISPECIES: hypothetical protein [Pseudomonas]|nr:MULTISPECIES: hypothetical protein [Pseudomonas]SCW52239.1 hypothetical protein SAMN03159424_01396 [Pseudomonas sp. NFACC05-1]SEJ67128.1 hypothetical protein SAMN03159298_03946 [Pseudomonas sp. NFACC07-1]SFL44190.1 hypothetical protein SAMN03159307_02553 [Pseudomonas sp. NFACC46-3]
MRKYLRHFKRRLKRWQKLHEYDFCSGKQAVPAVFFVLKAKKTRV